MSLSGSTPCGVGCLFKDAFEGEAEVRIFYARDDSSHLSVVSREIPGYVYEV